MIALPGFDRNGLAGGEGGPPPGGTQAPPAPLSFSAPSREKIERLKARYPTREALLLPVLRIAEEEFGGIGEAAIGCVARELSLSPAYVLGVFSFYTHFRREGEGRYILQVCATLSCSLRGCREVLRYLTERLGIHPGETSPDGRFTLKKVECLGSCGTAPVIQVNDDYLEDLTIEKLEKILEALP